MRAVESFQRHGTVGVGVAHMVDRLGRSPRHKGGSMISAFGLSFIPIILCVGAGVDYSVANKVKTKLDAIADAAALAAVDHQAMSVSADLAQNTAKNIFNTQALALSNVSISNVSADVADNGLSRTAVVSYTATKSTAFMG